AVTVKTNPSGQTCTVSNGSGTVGSANVTNVAVACSSTATFTIGGAAAGVSGAAVLQDNRGGDPSGAADGAFASDTRPPRPAARRGAAHAVPVKTNPSGQTCTVSKGSGTVGSANVTSVAVACSSSTATFTVGGTVSGLSGTVVLQDNGGDDLSVSANGSF